MPDSVTVRRVRMSESDRVRGIRLEALGDPAADVAFLETLEVAQQRPSEFWQERTIGAALSDDAAQFIAEAGRDWVGTVTALAPQPESGGVPRALLVAVYVRPSYRGTGVLESLVDAAAEWVRDQGVDTLALDVHEDNLRAQRAYGRLGFVATGETWMSVNGTEREMVRAL